MNFKRIINVILILTLTACITLAVTACGGCKEHVDANYDYKCDECEADMTPACTYHMDENEDKICDVCATAFTPNCAEHEDNNGNDRCDYCGKFIITVTEVDVTVTVKDQDGNAMASALVKFISSGDTKYEATTDAAGTVTVKVETGTYTVTVDSETLPEYHLPDSVTKEITATETVALEVLNNTPNGSRERPFAIGEELESLAIPAATKYNYIVYHASGRTLTLTNASIKVVYNGAEYLPDENGTVTVKLVEEDTNSHSFFTIENTTDAEITVAVAFISPLGSYANPIAIEAMDVAITAENTKDGMVYYVWVATEAGTFTITTESADKTIVIAASKDDVVIANDIISGSNTTSEINVTEGTKVLISVSSTNAEEVTFTPSFEA